MSKFWYGVLVAMAVAGCVLETDQPEEARPQQAGQPLDPVATAARIAEIRARAIVGDREGAQHGVEAFQDDLRRSMKLPDGRRPIDREQARAAIRGVDGVRSVAWVDRSNLLVIVDRNERRSYATIDDICLALEPLGDTLAVVVHLQSGAAKNGDDLAVLSRNCQLAPGDRALMQADRKIDVVDPGIRARHKAAQGAEPPRDREAEQRESMRILEASTPEM